MSGLAVVGLVSAWAPAWAHPDIDIQIADLTERIEARPDDPELYLRRGDLHRVHRDWSAAEADFLRARKVAPELARVDLFIGRTKLEAGEYAEAKKHLDRFLQKSPEHAEGRILAARALVGLGRNEAAAAEFDRALGSFDGDARPKPTHYIERSRALEAVGRLDEAVRGLDQGLARLGEPVTLQLYAIDLEQARGRYDAALERLQRIAARSARQEAWLIRKAEILEAAGRAPEARTAYRGALEAIESLPASRRTTRAVQSMVASAETALERLEESH